MDYPLASAWACSPGPPGLEAFAAWLFYALAAYGVLGVLFAVPFILLGAARIDPNAEGATAGFRILIFPGCVALWPWLLARVMGRRQREERSPHRAPHA